MIEEIQNDRNVLSPILSIRHDQGEGLKFFWNFKGMDNRKTEMTHVFIFSGISLQRAEIILQQYYKQVCYGDIIGLLYFDEIKNCSRIQWSEKSIHEFKSRKMTTISLNYTNFCEVIQAFLPKLKKRKGITSINFCIETIDQLQKADSQEQIGNFILAWRKQNTDSCGTIIINIVANCCGESYIDMYTGVNIFYLKEGKLQQIILKIKQYHASISLGKVQICIQIKSENISIGRSKNNGWISLDFTNLEKIIYGVPNFEYTQTLVMMSTGSSQPIFLDLCFHLSFTFLNGNECKSKKQLSLIVDGAKIQNKTVICQLYNPLSLIQIGRGNYLFTNLLNNFHYVGLKKHQQIKKQTRQGKYQTKS